MTDINPQEIIVRGRLSWPRLTMAAAEAGNAKSKFAKTADKVKPSFNLVVDEVRAERLVRHIVDTFLPWTVEQGKAKGKSGLTSREAKQVQTILDSKDWTEPKSGIMGLIVPMNERTAEYAPEGVFEVKVNGFAGRDLDTFAKVTNVNQLRVPDDDLIIPEKGTVMRLNDTNLEMYPGAVVLAKINLFAFVSANTPGITASTSSLMFVRDEERFGGGGGLTDAEIEMALEDDEFDDED